MNHLRLLPLPSPGFRSLLLVSLCLLAACGGSDEEDASDTDVTDAGGGSEDIAPGMDADPVPPDAARDTTLPPGPDVAPPAPDVAPPAPDADPADAGVDATLPDTGPDEDTSEEETGGEDVVEPPADVGELDSGVDPDTGADDVEEDAGGEPGWVSSLCSRESEVFGSAETAELEVDREGRTLRHVETRDWGTEDRTNTWGVDGRLQRSETLWIYFDSETGDEVDREYGVETWTWSEAAPSLAGEVTRVLYYMTLDEDGLVRTEVERTDREGRMVYRLFQNREGVQQQLERLGPLIDGGFGTLFYQNLEEDEPWALVTQTVVDGRIVRQESVFGGGTPEVLEQDYDATGRPLELRRDRNNDGTWDSRLVWAYNDTTGRTVQSRFEGEAEFPSDVYITIMPPGTGAVTSTESISAGFGCFAYAETYDATGEVLLGSRYRAWDISGPEACLNAWESNTPARSEKQTTYGPFGEIRFEEGLRPDGRWNFTVETEYLPEGFIARRIEVTLLPSQPGIEPEEDVVVFDAEVERDDAGRLTLWRLPSSTGSGSADVAFFEYDDAGRILSEVSGQDGDFAFLMGVNRRWDENGRVSFWSSFQRFGSEEETFVMEAHTMTYEDTFPFVYCFPDGAEPGNDETGLD